MMKERFWMPLYVGHYLADTMDLTKAEHGSYLLAIMAYWQKGGALTSKELRAVSGREVDRVSKFFVMCDGLWHHKRVDEELRKAAEKMEASRQKALKGVEARRRLGLLPAAPVGIRRNGQ